MRRTRMIWMLAQQWLQDGHRFTKIREVVYVFAGKRHQRECVEGRRFLVLRELPVEYS